MSLQGIVDILWQRSGFPGSDEVIQPVMRWAAHEVIAEYDKWAPF